MRVSMGDGKWERAWERESKKKNIPTLFAPAQDGGSAKKKKSCTFHSLVLKVSKRSYSLVAPPSARMTHSLNLQGGILRTPSQTLLTLNPGEGQHSSSTPSSRNNKTQRPNQLFSRHERVFFLFFSSLSLRLFFGNPDCGAHQEESAYPSRSDQRIRLRRLELSRNMTFPLVDVCPHSSPWPWSTGLGVLSLEHLIQVSLLVSGQIFSLFLFCFVLLSHSNIYSLTVNIYNCTIWCPTT